MMIVLMIVMTANAVIVMAVNIQAVMKSAGHTAKYAANTGNMMTNPLGIDTSPLRQIRR